MAYGFVKAYKSTSYAGPALNVEWRSASAANVDGENVEGVKGVSAWDLSPQVNLEYPDDWRISWYAGSRSPRAASSYRYRAAPAHGSGASRGLGDG